MIFFWFSFHQNGTSLSLFARDFVATDTIAPEIWQAVNPFFVMYISGPIHSRRLPTAVAPSQRPWQRPSFREMAASAKEGLKAGPWVLIALYFFLTVAELFISPLGLSFVSKVAPKHYYETPSFCRGLRQSDYVGFVAFDGGCRGRGVGGDSFKPFVVAVKYPLPRR